MKKTILTLTIVLTGCTSLFAQNEEEMSKVLMPKDIAQQVIRHKGFTVNFNTALMIPNYVAWELTAKEASATKVSRTDEFLPEPALKGKGPSSFDYSHSGFDRGHMAPAADMKWDADAMTESFMMSNICPQVKSLNEGAWLELEQMCRYWAKKYGSIFIVCGPLFTRDEARYIGESEVAVPDAFFKVVCQKRKGEWVGMGFVFPNIGNTPVSQTMYPISAIEYLTGYNFFSVLDDETERKVESSTDTAPWIIPNWN